MAKKISELIRELSIKAGIKQDDTELVAFLANDQLNATVPDTVFNGLNQSLLSVDAAVNNHSHIKSHYFKAAYDGLDKTVRETMDELELPDDVKNEVLRESSSTRRAALLAKKVREIERAGKKNEATPAELQQLRDSVNALNLEAAKLKEHEQKLVERHKKEIKEIHKSGKLSTLVSKFQTIFDGANPDVKMAGINAAINTELAANGALMDLDETEKWMLTKKDGTNFFNENHVLVTPEQFIESALSKNNILLKNNNGNNGTRGGQPFQTSDNNRGQNQTRPGNNAGDNQRNINSRAASIIDDTLAHLERNSTGTKMM